MILVKIRSVPLLNFLFKQLFLVAFIIWNVMGFIGAGTWLPYRFLVYITARVFRRDLVGFQTTGDHAFGLGKAIGEGTPCANMACITVVDGDISISKFRLLFQQRVLNAVTSDGRFVYQKLKLDYEIFGGYGFTKKCEKDFDLKHHVRDWDYSDLNLPPEPTERDLVKVTDSFVGKPWEKGRSPWECVLIHKFRHAKDEGEVGRKLVIVFRWDHSLGDGYSIYLLQRKLFKAVENFEVPQLRHKHWYVRLFRKIAFPVKVMLDGADLFYECWCPLPEWSNVGTSMTYGSSLSERIPIGLIKTIKNAYQVNYFVVVLVAFSEALHRVYKEAGKSAPEKVKFDYPLPKPNHPGGMDNYMYMGRMLMHIKPNHTIEDIQIINGKYEATRVSFARQYYYWAVTVGSHVPTFILKLALFIINVDSLIVGNFPVSTEKLELEGHKILDGWTTGCAANKKFPLRAGITSFGYAGAHRFYSFIDKSILPEDFSKFGRYVEEALVQMYQECQA